MDMMSQAERRRLNFKTLSQLQSFVSDVVYNINTN